MNYRDGDGAVIKSRQMTRHAGPTEDESDGPLRFAIARIGLVKPLEMNAVGIGSMSGRREYGDCG